MTLNISRLERLCTILDDVDAKHFDLTNWASPRCGTTACAVGWAALDPGFREEGFHLVAIKTRVWSSEQIFFEPSQLSDVKAGLLWDSFGGAPCFEDKKNWDAVRAFFGVTQPQARWLFLPSSYSEVEARNPRAVARRIRTLLDATPVAPKLEREVLLAITE